MFSCVLVLDVSAGLPLTGFVSYDNRDSAEKAISQMNGYQVRCYDARECCAARPALSKASRQDSSHVWMYGCRKKGWAAWCSPSVSRAKMARSAHNQNSEAFSAPNEN